MKIPLSQPDIGPAEREYVRDALASDWISGTGPYLERFEAAIAQRVGRANVVAVSSGTTALELVLAALEIGPGHEVIVPALTFAAPAAAVLNAGATPVLCDVSAGDWTLDVTMAEGLVTPRTRAVIAVDVLGHPCDYERLAGLGLPVIEDAAQAHGAAAGGRPAGGFGVASTFSFHANKAVTTGEGGCVATDDPALAARVRLLANHGMTADRPYFHTVAGRNGRMTNLTAALGLAQVERWSELTAGRRRAGDRYAALTAELGFGSRPVRPGVDAACWLHTVDAGAADRDRLVRRGRDAGVDVRPIWPALPDLPLYEGHTPVPCPNATAIARSCLWLPTWSAMTDHDIDAVVAAVFR